MLARCACSRPVRALSHTRRRDLLFYASPCCPYHARAQWHLGYVTPEYCPWRRGFASSEGYFASGVDKFSKCSFKAPVLSDVPIRAEVADSWCRVLNSRFTTDADAGQGVDEEADTAT